MESQLTLNYIKGIIRRRKNIGALLFISILTVFVVIALLLPAIYRSRVEILIENQQIPEDYVKSTSTSYAEQRLEKISRKVMSYSKLVSMIEKHNLYSDLISKGDISSAVSELHSSISLETTDTRIGNRQVTTSFSLAFEGKDPETVRLVTNELANLYVLEETKARDIRSEATTDFLSEELENLKSQIQAHEDRISKFKAAHIGELPENASINLQTIAKLERELEGKISRIRSLEERKLYLGGQISSVEPLKPIQTEDGKLTQNPSEQLKGMRLKLISLQSTLSDKHPDIRRLKGEIRKLESQVGGGGELNEKYVLLDDKKTQLAESLGVYGDKHPDVKRLKREIEILNKDIIQLKKRTKTRKQIDTQPDNPVYINLKTQIVSAETEIRNLKIDIGQIEENLRKHEGMISRAPLIEQEYSELTLDYQNAKQKYNEILNKLLEAKLSKGMEQKQQGEKFTITAPAYLPSSPYKPNRLAIILLGAVLSVGAVIGYVSIAERMDQTIKDENELSIYSELPILTSLSYIQTNEEKRSRRTKRFVLVAMVFLFLAMLMLFTKMYLPVVGELLSAIIS